jgi:DNA polymerase-3 subunit epsilon
MSRKYAIVDIETTGGNPSRDKITEIAIVIHDGQQIIDEFQSLINPERYIPAGITELTGITQEMVDSAPKFFEVAKQIVEMTQGAVFVAHNVRFDYGFIKKEFSRLGYAYTRQQLCTVRMSRKSFPGLRSYSLSNLIRHFNIPIEGRHRAMGDVKATVQLFEHILEKERDGSEIKDMINLGIKESLLPPGIDMDQIHALPESCGVYYLHDQDGNVAYVGKSINIKKRVADHFANLNKKGGKVHRIVRDISFEETGSELIALLLESYEIKRLQPPINRAQRRTTFPYVMYAWKDENGYMRLTTDKVKLKERKKLRIIGEYPSIASARGRLGLVNEEFSLCGKLTGKEKGTGACFGFHLKQCQGACLGQETPEEYNAKVEEAIPYLGIAFDEDFILIDEGRHEEERSVVVVENNRFQGFGFVTAENGFQSVEELKNAIDPYPHTPENLGIIQRYMSKSKKKVQVVKIE